MIPGLGRFPGEGNGYPFQYSVLDKSKDCIVLGMAIQSAKIRPGADCGSDHELLIAKFRLKLKQVEKTTTAFRYNLNQIPYDCTVEVRKRFKGLDLIDRVPDELWTEVCDIVQETGIKTIPKKKKCKKAKWLSAEALQTALKRREAKSKRKKERYKHVNAHFQRIARCGLFRTMHGGVSAPSCCAFIHTIFE